VHLTFDITCSLSNFAAATSSIVNISTGFSVAVSFVSLFQKYTCPVLAVSSTVVQAHRAVSQTIIVSSPLLENSASPLVSKEQPRTNLYGRKDNE
jgi:hypothetical protein